MTQHFHILEDVVVILRSKRGVYRQVKVYVRGDALYAGYGSGFVRLMHYGTSNPDVSWEDLTPHNRITITRLSGPKFRDNIYKLEAAE